MSPTPCDVSLLWPAPRHRKILLIPDAISVVQESLTSTLPQLPVNEGRTFSVKCYNAAPSHCSRYCSTFHGGRSDTPQSCPAVTRQFPTAQTAGEPTLAVFRCGSGASRTGTAGCSLQPSRYSRKHFPSAAHVSLFPLSLSCAFAPCLCLSHLFSVDRSVSLSAVRVSLTTTASHPASVSCACFGCEVVTRDQNSDFFPTVIELRIEPRTHEISVFSGQECPCTLDSQPQLVVTKC